MQMLMVQLTNTSLFEPGFRLPRYIVSLWKHSKISSNGTKLGLAIQSLS